MAVTARPPRQTTPAPCSAAISSSEQPAASSSAVVCSPMPTGGERTSAGVALKRGAGLAMGTDHPAYEVTVAAVSPEVRSALVADLA